MSKFYESPHQLEPYVLTELGDVEPLIEALLEADNRLKGQLHPLTQVAISGLVRDVECRYSNLIEGHRTVPTGIAAAHDETDAAATRWRKAGAAPYTAAFIQKMHLVYCKSLASETLVPGHWREQNVQVSRHIPPAAASIPAFMNRFEETQKPRGGNLLQVANAIAGHHRLTWIHPFADGNGRISRIATDAQLRHLGVNVAGLWSWSRGLAKNQARYMSAMLDLDGLKVRVQNHFVRERPDIPPEAARIVLQALAFGEVRRGDAKVVSGLGDRSAQALVKRLVEEGYLTSPTPKGPVRVAFPLRAIGTFFPNLFPAGSLEA